MKEKMFARIAKVTAFALAVVIAVANINVMNVHAADTDSKIAEQALTSNSYDDINTLGATMTVKANSLKVKKNYAAQKPAPTKVVVNGVTLKKNKTYAVSYQVYDRGWKDVVNLTTPGTYRMMVEGIGDYYGICTKRIYVYDSKESVPMSSVSVAVNKVAYTGNPITDGVIESVKYKKNVLVEGEDYTVSYLSNVNSGTGIVRISAVEGTGFVGEKDVKFTITGGTSIAKAKVTGITAQTYDNGNALTQDMSQVKVSLKGRDLTECIDYVVSYYMNNKKPGTAKVVFTGKGRYNGTLTKTFKINKPKLNYSMLDEDSTNIVELYTKKAVKPDVTIDLHFHIAA